MKTEAASPKKRYSSAKRLAEIVDSLRALEPFDDRAIDLVHEGLFVLKNGANHRRFHGAAMPVLSFWRDSLVKLVSEGYSVSDSDDARGAAMLWLYEQLGEYRVSETTGVAPYLRTRQSWFKSAYRMSLSPGVHTQGRYTILGIASSQKEKFLEAQHREPSLSELREQVESAAYAQTYAKVVARPGNERISKTEADKETRAKMVRDGLASALKDFSAVLVSSAPSLYINTDEDQEPSVTASCGMVDLPQAPEETDVDGEEDKYSKLLSVSLGDDLWAERLLDAQSSAPSTEFPADADNSSLRFFAEEHKKEVKYLKNLLSLAKVRATAPHAHWAHLTKSAPRIRRS